MMDDVEIHLSTVVWQFASLIRGAKVGANCTIGVGAIIDAAIVGDRCLIGAYAQLHPGTVLGNGVFVGPGTIFCNDAWPRFDKSGFDSARLINKDFVTVRVGNDASIGANCVILPGISIGAGSVIAAGSRVDRSVPDYSLHKARGEVVPISPREPLRMRSADHDA